MQTGDTSDFSEFGSLVMEITAIRLVLRRGFVLSEYVSEDYNEREREKKNESPASAMWWGWLI